MAPLPRFALKFAAQGPTFEAYFYFDCKWAPALPFIYISTVSTPLIEVISPQLPIYKAIYHS